MAAPVRKRYLLPFLNKNTLNFHVEQVQYLPRYAVVFIDVLLLVIALGITILSLQTLDITFQGRMPPMLNVLLVLGINILFFFIYRTYAGLIRHSSFIDLLKLTFASASTLLFLSLVHYVYLVTTGEKLFVIMGLMLYIFLSFTLLLIFRIFIKQFYKSLKNKFDDVPKLKVLIFGVDDQSISLGEALAGETGQKYYLSGFLSKKSLNRVRILGRPVIKIKITLNETLSNLNVDGILIIGKNLSVRERNEIVNACIENNLKVFDAPIVEELDSARDISGKIKTIDIEDLLDREPIELDNIAIKEDIQGATILITGAAGSIGSELVRQIAMYNPGKIVLVDQAETPLHSLELELQEKFPKLNFKTVLATISNKYRMEALFKKHNFSLVFNAAAYKHVPMVEKNPREGIVVNVLGTVNLAMLSSKYHVRKFVMVSTDKAVNPTNVMGASKRAAEIYVQAFQETKNNKTQFITTRFGNVLGSNGSVIPYFRDQIAKGGPVTVTHPDIIRYFMTISEACQLVLQAGAMGRGGEIFIFDMGKPVKILDLAKRMIRLSGFQPYIDIDIKITGLRPGEKLYEELLSDLSTTLPTHNKKILISKDVTFSYEEVEDKMKQLIRAAIKAEDKKEMVKLLKILVPEFISQNSIYESLDAEGIQSFENIECISAEKTLVLNQIEFIVPK